MYGRCQYNYRWSNLWSFSNKFLSFLDNNSIISLYKSYLSSQSSNWFSWQSDGAKPPHPQTASIAAMTKASQCFHHTILRVWETTADCVCRPCWIRWYRLKLLHGRSRRSSRHPSRYTYKQTARHTLALFPVMKSVIALYRWWIGRLRGFPQNRPSEFIVTVIVKRTDRHIRTGTCRRTNCDDGRSEGWV